MLVLVDREEISRGLAEGVGFKEIALRIGRDSSVISRDVARHGGRAGYRSAAAGQRGVRGPWPAESVRGRAVDRGCVRWCAGGYVRAGPRPRSRAGCPPIYPEDHACRVHPGGTLEDVLGIAKKGFF